MFKDFLDSAKEWWVSVSQRWWDMLSIPLSAIPLIVGVVALIIWGRNVSPPLPIWNIALIIGGTLLFSVLSFLAFHRVRKEREQYREKDKSLYKNDIKLMEWRKEYRKSQVAEVSQIPATLKTIWILVNKATEEKMKKKPSEDKLISVVADSLQIDKNDPILNTSRYSTEDKIRKATKQLKVKMGLRKSNAEIEARWRKRLSETMDDHEIGLLLKKNQDYTTLIEQLKNEGEPISKTMVYHKIDSFLENLSALYSIKLFVRYGHITEKLYIFPREMRETFKHLEDAIERVMRTLFTQVKEALEEYSIGRDLKDE